MEINGVEHKTHKEKRWRITYTNKLGIATNTRFTYMQMGFSSEEAANRECTLVIKNHDPERSSNEDYRVDSYIANMLDTPINPFKDDKTEEDEE